MVAKPQSRVQLNARAQSNAIRVNKHILPGRIADSAEYVSLSLFSFLRLRVGRNGKRIATRKRLLGKFGVKQVPTGVNDVEYV